MLAKGPSAVITFPNTVAALAMESACREAAIPGRIIPVPNQIDAGCGFAWCAEAAERGLLEGFLREKQLVYAGIYTIDL